MKTQWKSVLGSCGRRLRQTRARFKLCLRWYRAHEEELRDPSLGVSGDTTSFSRGIQALTSYSHKLPLQVDKAMGMKNVIFWGNYNKGALNFVNDDKSECPSKSEAFSNTGGLPHHEMWRSRGSPL